MIFYCLNQSTRLTLSDMETSAAILERYLNVHVAPAWDTGRSLVAMCESELDVPAGTTLAIFADGINDPGAFGLHRNTTDGPLVLVDVEECFAMGAESALIGATSPLATASHEFGETAVDPKLDRWVQGPGGMWAVEPWDFVENWVYRFDGGDVGDFCLPGHFVEGATSELDHLGRAKAAFSVPAGHAVVKAADGSRTTLATPGMGLRAKSMRRGSRTMRRLACAG